MHGAFAISTMPGIGKVLRQQAGPIKPLCTHGGGAEAYAAVIGDASWGAGYTVQSAIMSQGGMLPGSPEFVFIGSHHGPDRMGGINPSTWELSQHYRAVVTSL